MDKKQTIQWVVTAVLRLVAGYIAIKFGKDLVDEQTWTTLGEGLACVVIVVLSIFTSVKARKTLLAQEPPKSPDVTILP